MAAINKLGKLALAGFVACCGSYYLFQNSLSKFLIKSEFCKDAMELVRNHNGAKLYLGEPIEVKTAKFSSYENQTTKSVEMLVSGCKSKGKVFLTINKTEKDKPELSTVQLQVEGDDSKRLEIKSQVVSPS